MRRIFRDLDELIRENHGHGFQDVGCATFAIMIRSSLVPDPHFRSTFFGGRPPLEEYYYLYFIVKIDEVLQQYPECIAKQIPDLNGREAQIKFEMLGTLVNQFLDERDQFLTDATNFRSCYNTLRDDPYSDPFLMLPGSPVHGFGSAIIGSLYKME